MNKVAVFFGVATSWMAALHAADFTAAEAVGVTVAIAVIARVFEEAMAWS